MNTTPGSKLVKGDSKCWKHNGKYLGKYLSFNLIGRSYDPDPEYTFEHGVVSGLGLKFTEVPCESSSVGGKRRKTHRKGRKTHRKGRKTHRKH